MARPPADKRETSAERLRRLGVREEDLEESFVRAGGKGGQNVNKVATCVVLVHRPSGLAVKCQEERSQAMNRERARSLLADKIERQVQARAQADAARLAKLRRQKQRRSRATKEKILSDKRARASTKSRRGRVVSSDGD